MRIAHQPERVDVGIALVPGVVAAVVLAFDVRATLAAVVGLAVIAFGARRANRRLVTVGGGLLFLGVLLVGTADVPPAVVVVAMAGTVLTWDSAQHVIGLADQLGREAATRRATVVHLALSTAVATVFSAIAAAVFVAGSAGQRLAVILLLVVGAVVLLLVLEP